MKNIFNYLLFFLISFTIIFIFPKADSCNYKEQAALNKEAKNVQINYELVDKLDEYNNLSDRNSYNPYDYYYLQVNLLNLTENLYSEITNDIDDEKIVYYYSNTQDGFISFKKTSEQVITYKLNIYANTETCNKKF